MTRILVALVLGFGLVSSASAYVPPSDFLMKTMARKRQGFKGVRIKTAVMKADATPLFQETFWVDYGFRKERGWITDAQGQELYVYERPWDGTRSPPALLAYEPRPEALIPAMIAQGVPIRTETELSSMKTPEERRAAEKTMISRMSGLPTWVIGDGTPSIWIRKDEFQLFRFVGRWDSELIDARFIEYRVVREYPLPWVVELRQGEDLILRGDTREALPNPDTKEWVKGPLMSGFTELGNTLDSRTRDLILKWTQWMR